MICKLEHYAVGEHEVGDAAVKTFGHAAGVVVVEEVVEGHGEGEEVSLVAVAVGEGEGEVETQAALYHLFVGVAPVLEGAGAGEGFVVEHAYLKSFAVFAEDEPGTGL